MRKGGRGRKVGRGGGGGEKKKKKKKKKEAETSKNKQQLRQGDQRVSAIAQMRSLH